MSNQPAEPTSIFNIVRMKPVAIVAILALNAGSFAYGETSFDNTPAERTHRSSERNSYSIEQIGKSLMTPALPDPAKAFSSDDSTKETTYSSRHSDWSEGAWITGIGTLVYNDSDHDGYFSGFSLTIDADTDDSDSEVFVEIYAQTPYGEREHLHTSNAFYLYGNTITDEYRIDIELVQNYPSSEYDLHIELFSAFNTRLLDSVNANDFNNLANLPLESEDYDTEPFEQPSPPSSYNDNIRVVEHAGGMSGGILLFLAVAATLRRRLRAGIVTS